MGAGILHRVFANVGRVSYLFRMGFSRFFFSSPFQSPAKAGIQEERIHCRTWKELNSILVLDKVTTLVARWTQQKTQCVNQFSAWQDKEQYYSLWGDSPAGQCHVEGSSLRSVEATAHIRSQTCSSVMLFEVWGVRRILETPPTEVVVSGPSHPTPQRGAQSGST